jgi:hypothetical protein
LEQKVLLNCDLPREETAIPLFVGEIRRSGMRPMNPLIVARTLSKWPLSNPTKRLSLLFTSHSRSSFLLQRSPITSQTTCNRSPRTIHGLRLNAFRWVSTHQKPFQPIVLPPCSLPVLFLEHDRHLQLVLPSESIAAIEYIDAPKELSSLTTTVPPPKSPYTVTLRIYSNDTAADLVENIQEELHHRIMKVRVSSSYKSLSSVLNDADLQRLSAVDLMRDNYTLWITTATAHIPFRFDLSQARHMYEETMDTLHAHKIKSSRFDALESQINRTSQMYARMVEVFALLYLMAQLWVVVTLTYQLGWDLMGAYNGKLFPIFFHWS